MNRLSIVFDTFNDTENTLCFNVTPAGLRMDAAVSNDAQNQTELICREQRKELFFRDEFVQQTSVLFSGDMKIGASLKHHPQLTQEILDEGVINVYMNYSDVVYPLPYTGNTDGKTG